MIDYELPVSLSGGQRIVYIDFSEIKSRSVAETLKLVEELDYYPQLRYLETPNGIQLYALLRFEQLDPNEPIPEDHWVDDVMKLCEQFPNEPLAVRYSLGVPQKSEVMA